MSALCSGLRCRLIILVFLALLPALGLILYSGLEQRQGADREARENTLRLVRQAALHQEQMIQGASQLLLALAALPGIQQRHQATVSMFLASLLLQNPAYANIAIIGAQGNVLYSALPFDGAINIAHRPWFQQVLKTRNLVLGEYLIGRISGKASLPLAYPVFDQSGEIKVIVVLALDLNWLSNLSAQTQLPEGSTCAIIDRNGTILVRHPHPEHWVGKTIPDMPYVKQLLDQGEGTGEGTGEARGIDGTRRLYAFTPIRGASEGLFIRIGIPQHLIFAQANRILRHNLTALGIVTVIAGLSAWMFGSILIMRKVKVLISKIQQLAGGELGVRTGLGQGEGEIDQLARAFDQMAETMEHRQADRQRVGDELERMNRYLENIFDDSADSIGIVDGKGQFLKWNKAAKELYGYRLEELQGKSAFELYPDKNELDTMLQRLHQEGLVRNYEIKMRRRDGTIAPFALSIRLLRDSNNQSYGSVCVARDLSDYKRTMVELNAMNTQLQEEIRERGQVEQALHRAVQEVEQRNREITMLNDLNDVLQACQNNEEAYAGIVHFVPQLFPHLSGSLLILNPAKNFLESVVTWGACFSSETLFAPDKCWALRRGEVHLWQASLAGLPCQHMPETLSTDYMCIPMIAQGEILGLLVLQANFKQPEEEGTPTISEPEQRLALNVAKQIALSLANLNLRATLHSQAILDPLTGLFNRRYMEDNFIRELYRAQRKELLLGAILLDLDHFKRINDKFGHEAGDAVLATVARCLKNNTRREDIVCRYGGEEFLLVLPESSLETTLQRAEQLRELISTLEITHLGHPLGVITASFGVAGYPQHGKTREEIIRAADTSLYRAKQEGRNRVCVAGNST
jgi:diguanylate cyclase (GGDEF)-like protein/PAS domain S-box-containing protein